MTPPRTFLPLASTALAVALVVVPGIPLLRAVGGVFLLLYAPGYAATVAVLRRTGPAGETVATSVAVSVAITGLGSFVLALAHALGRPEIIMLDGAIGVAAGAVVVAGRRASAGNAERAGVQATGRGVDAVPASDGERLVDARSRLLAVGAGVVATAVVICAFAPDVTSARAEQQRTSASLSAVDTGGTVGIQVVAPGDRAFSGLLRLTGAGVTREWTVRMPRAGTWSPPGRVLVPGTGDGLRIVLREGGTPVRVLQVTAQPDRAAEVRP